MAGFVGPPTDHRLSQVDAIDLRIILQQILQRADPPFAHLRIARAQRVLQSRFLVILAARVLFAPIWIVAPSLAHIQHRIPDKDLDLARVAFLQHVFEQVIAAVFTHRQ